MSSSSAHHPPLALSRFDHSASSDYPPSRNSTEFQKFPTVYSEEADVEHAFDSACDDDEYAGSPISESFEFEHQAPSDAKQSLLSAVKPKLTSWTKQRRRRSSPPKYLKFWQGRASSPGSCAFHRRRKGALGCILRYLAFTFMLLGLFQFLIVIFGLFAGLFPDEFDDSIDRFRGRHRNRNLGWPTDASADMLPVACHSHNDYWREVPLKSALATGCTGVEADVWHFPENPNLLVGHSKSSLTTSRTFTSLYVDPLVEILDRQNPNTTFNPTPDQPRNGVYDTYPEQTLVLLIDFKTDGAELWSHVSRQLQPLRSKKYLRYFNGTDIVPGPVTVVVTGNAPFNKVVENPRYRDMFFDAPLDMMASLALSEQPPPSPGAPHSLELKDKHKVHPTDLTTKLNDASNGHTKPLSSTSDPSNQGQGHSGSAPTNPSIYSPANSYYASVSFKKSIGTPLPYLTDAQRAKIRAQIAGAHERGLKVRYWATPDWPIGLREYIWRVLVREGVDYLNVDDLRAATRGHWMHGSSRRAWRSGGLDTIWGRKERWGSRKGYP